MNRKLRSIVACTIIFALVMGSAITVFGGNKPTLTSSTNTNASSGETENSDGDIKKIITEMTRAYFYDYFKSIVDLRIRDSIKQYMVDNNDMYFNLKLLEHEIYYRSNYGDPIRYAIVSVEILGKKTRSNGDVEASMYVNNQSYGAMYDMLFSKKHDYKIAELSEESPEWRLKEEEIPELKNGQGTEKSEEIYKKIDKKFRKFKREMDEINELLEEIERESGDAPGSTKEIKTESANTPDAMKIVAVVLPQPMALPFLIMQQVQDNTPAKKDSVEITGKARNGRK